MRFSTVIVFLLPFLFLIIYADAIQNYDCDNTACNDWNSEKAIRESLKQLKNLTPLAIKLRDEIVNLTLRGSKHLERELAIMTVLFSDFYTGWIPTLSLDCTLVELVNQTLLCKGDETKPGLKKALKLYGRLVLEAIDHANHRAMCAAGCEVNKKVIKVPETCNIRFVVSDFIQAHRPNFSEDILHITLELDQADTLKDRLLALLVVAAHTKPCLKMTDALLKKELLQKLIVWNACNITIPSACCSRRRHLVEKDNSEVGRMVIKLTGAN